MALRFHSVGSSSVSLIGGAAGSTGAISALSLQCSP
jgi:hypothetical protein